MADVRFLWKRTIEFKNMTAVYQQHYITHSL